jgi:hypothetical protein
MNVEIGAEAALFTEKEYINGVAVAVHSLIKLYVVSCLCHLGLLFKKFFGSFFNMIYSTLCYVA